jgi:hypothetical protein
MLLFTGFMLMTDDLPAASPAENRMLTDFTSATEDLNWFVVNDNVMGGRSSGDFSISKGQLVFAGRTNTLGGGFSSLRTRMQPIDLAGYDGIRLRVKGDGRRYIWQLSTSAQFRGRDVRFWAAFDTTADAWSTVDLPFSAFAPRFRGEDLRGVPFEPATITGMGLMIYDGRDGEFVIEVDVVRAYLDRPPERL